MFITPTLTIDLAAIVANWQKLRAQFTGDECAAVVKADAYGLGMVPVATALAAAGCDTFFVATLEEAIELRAALPDVRVLVFHGVQAGEEFAFASHRLIPVLNSHAQIDRWKAVAAEHVHAVSALHVDTGMGRMGLQPEDFAELIAAQPDILLQCRVGLILSHLACAPESTHSQNAHQLALFKAACALAPGIPASFANSGGDYLAPDYHFQLARPGCALYGISPQEHLANPMRHVATWHAPILMTRTLHEAQAVGYGATMTLPKGTRLATVASGYADGYLRHLSGKAVGYIGEHKVRLVGRVTMDMLVFDVSEVPEALVYEGALLTLLGDQDGIRVDEIAAVAETIGYEVLTRIGARVKRVYMDA